MADPEDLMQTMYLHAVEFVDAIGGSIRRLKVTAGEVSLEAEWVDQYASSDRHASAANGATPNGQGPDGAVVSGVAPAAATAASQGAAATMASVIPSPTVGTFYRCPEPGAEPFVKEGDLVVPGRQVAILEAMKMMNPIHAITAGRITRILVEDATAVEYGQALFVLEES